MYVPSVICFSVDMVRNYVALTVFLLLTTTGETTSIFKIPLSIGTTQRLLVQPSLNYSLTISPSNDDYQDYSAFIIQLHSQRATISLYNDSSGCISSTECATRGNSVGMIQFVYSAKTYAFKANVGCDQDSCQTNVSILVAVMGVGINNPIPGGCAHTSNLVNDPELTFSLMHNSKQLTFQGSNLGFAPSKSETPFVCDFNQTVYTRLEYFVYRHCLPAYDFSSSTYFDAIEQMLSQNLSGQMQTSLQGKDIKKILFDSTPSGGEVYNVIVLDLSLKTMSSYIPVVSYGCQLNANGSCDMSIPVLHMVLGPLIALIGLFLCFLAQRFFHIEVFVFPLLILTYLSFMLLNAVTVWPRAAITGGSIGLGSISSLLLYTIWFFLGWYYVYLVLFGLAANFIVTAAILFTPLGTMFPTLEVNYVYALILLCGCVFFLVFFVAFPRILNIVSSSLVGSYAIVFSVGLFKRTLVTQIVLRVVDNASVPGFLASPARCQIEMIDIILPAVWGLLFLAGIIIQSILAVQHQRAFRKRVENEKYSTTNVTTTHKYHPFPKSPYKKLKALCVNKQTKHYQPLLSPHTSSKLYGALN